MIERIINWSEVWSLLIPLAVILLFKPGRYYSRTLVVYVIIALVLNTLATVMVTYYFSMPSWLKNNNILYNLHSLTRVIFFSWFILRTLPFKANWIPRVIMGAYVIFMVINFAVNESPLFINALHFVAESVLLLLLCLLFFFRTMHDSSETNWLKHPAFIFCIGLSIFEAVSFFIFLFFYPLVLSDWEFGDLTMSIYNLVFVLLCIFIAITLYRSRPGSPASKG